MGRKSQGQCWLRLLEITLLLSKRNPGTLVGDNEVIYVQILCVCVWGGLKDKELSSMAPYTDDGNDHLVRVEGQEKAEANAQAIACK